MFDDFNALPIIANTKELCLVSEQKFLLRVNCPFEIAHLYLLLKNFCRLYVQCKDLPRGYRSRGEMKSLLHLIKVRIHT
jgi:hypothetical protein